MSKLLTRSIFLALAFALPAAAMPAKCTNLGNAFDAPAEGDWGYVVEEAHFDVLKAAGFGMVRLPVRWSAHVADAAPHGIDPAFLARVDDVINQSLARGLTTIVNVHHFNELYVDPAANREKFLAIWRQLSSHYASYPQTLYFEILNEPRDKLTGEALDTLLAEALAIIRAENPDRKVLMGGAPWNSLTSLEEMPWPDDPNLVGTFHYYDPHPFTHQGARWENPVQPVGVKWGSPEDYAEIERLKLRIERVQEKTGGPVILGEFGALAETISRKQRLPYYKAVREAAEAAGASWCTWNFSSDFLTYDVARKKWVKGMPEALGLTSGDGKE